LRLSHVTAKWTTEAVKIEGGGKLHAHLPSLGVALDTSQQDGTKHYLLCDACEQRMGRAENYVRTLTIGTDEERAATGITVVTEYVVGLNAELVQRFVLGTALRAHFATGAPFHNITLPADRVEPLRLALLRGIEYGVMSDQEFPVAARRLTTDDPGIDPQAVVLPLLYGASARRSWFGLIAGGWEFLLGLHHDDPGAPDLRKVRLRSGENLCVPMMDLLEHPQVVAAVSEPMAGPRSEALPDVPRRSRVVSVR